MAKELPYFKFEPSEWDNGNIQVCSRESRGLFIDICSMYWSRLGELPYKLALQKLCNGDANALQALLDENILMIENDQIVIEFLDEQLDEFQKTSEKRRDAANKRWNDASALQMQSKSNAIREDKSRLDKSKEEESKVIKKESDFCFTDFWDLYDYKKERLKTEKKWESLKESEKKDIMDVVALYVKSTPDKNFRKYPLTWLNGKCWSDEITTKANNNGIPSEPDQNWINIQGKDIQLYQKAAKIWRENGWEYIQPSGSTKRVWKLKEVN